jgi:hypothetical protein
MTFLAPIFLYIGRGVAAGAVALHFIVTRQPASSPLPTVRFVPTSSVRVTTVAPVPEDLLVLLLRVLLALLIGAALARPVLTPERRLIARVVLADVSRDVGSIDAVRDSARALLEPGDVLIAFDSVARVIRDAAADSAAGLARTGRSGRLSPALIAAMRAGSSLRDAADSVEVVIISPLRAGEADAATLAVRALWPGRLRIVRVAASPDSLALPSGLSVRGFADDPLAIAALAAGVTDGTATRAVAGNSVSGRDDAYAVRIIRGAASVADSSWAAGGEGETGRGGAGRRTLVRWPAVDAPHGWVERETPDTVGAVVAEEEALVFPLERRWRLDSTTRATRVVARWVDGEPAAIERTVGAGCIRDVAIPVPERGDLVLRPAFARFLRALTAPCDVAAGGPALDAARVAALAGEGPLAARGAVAPLQSVATPLVPWLLGAALLLALIELLVRHDPSRHSRTHAHDADSPAAEPEVAA